MVWRGTDGLVPPETNGMGAVGEGCERVGVAAVVAGVDAVLLAFVVLVAGGASVDVF